MPRIGRRDAIQSHWRSRARQHFASRTLGADASATYVDHGNDGIVRGVQVEDQGGLRVIDEILAVDGLSALFIGTGDLSLSSGLPAAHPDNDVLIANTLESCRGRSIPCGTAVGDAAAARAAAERGFRFVMVSNDATMFGTAAREHPACDRQLTSVAESIHWQAVNEGASVRLGRTFAVTSAASLGVLFLKLASPLGGSATCEWGKHASERRAKGPQVTGKAGRSTPGRGARRSQLWQRR